MEVVCDTGPQIIPQPNPEKYFVGLENSDDSSFYQPSPPHAPSTEKQGLHKYLWAVAVITVLCTTAALGAGLGVGLANHGKSNPLV